MRERGLVMRNSVLFVAAILLLAPGASYPAVATPVKKKARPVVRPEYDIRYSRAVGGEEMPISYDAPEVPVVTYASRQTGKSSVSTLPPPSPGLKIGQTSYDYQHNHSQGYQVARMPGADIVHFMWMGLDRIPRSINEADRVPRYQSYTVSTNTLNQGFWPPWCDLCPLSYAGYFSMDVSTTNQATVACHQREDPSLPFNPWSLWFPSPGVALHVDDGLGGYAWAGCNEVLWARTAASRDPGDSQVRHLIAHSNTNRCLPHLLWYWRYDGANWAGPVIVDSTPTLGYALADDRTGDKVAIVTHADNHLSMNGNNNVVFYESATDGAGWITGTEPFTQNLITSYGDPDGAQAWLHISTAYDNDGVLNVVWDEQRIANRTSDVAIRHWSSATQTIRPVAIGYWPTEASSGKFDLNLAKVTLGIGDGGTLCNGQPNDNYLYVLYTRFSGPTAEEQADHSALGFNNGELYLNVSSDGGLSWSPPANLTNTKTPNCNPGPADTLTGNPQNPNDVCRSEHWATIGMAVSDIDIFFISDLDAGGIPQGEGTWQLNPVMYYRIPGGTANAQFVCPLVAPYIYADVPDTTWDCQLHTPPGTVKSDLNLTVGNLGNAALGGTVSVLPGASWLTVTGAGAININAGSPDLSMPIVMSAVSLTPGIYSGMIRVTHNDALQPSPIDFPIELVVADEYHCPQEQVLKSGVEE